MSSAENENEVAGIDLLESFTGKVKSCKKPSQAATAGGRSGEKPAGGKQTARATRTVRKRSPADPADGNAAGPSKSDSQECDGQALNPEATQETDHGRGANPPAGEERSSSPNDREAVPKSSAEDTPVETQKSEKKRKPAKKQPISEEQDRAERKSASKKRPVTENKECAEEQIVPESKEHAKKQLALEKSERAEKRPAPEKPPVSGSKEHAEEQLVSESMEHTEKQSALNKLAHAKEQPASKKNDPEEKRKSVGTLEEFGREIFPFLDLKPFHRTYYRVLDAFARGKIRKLMISMPPQHGKSLGATTLLPAYLLGLNPDLRVAIASYSASLASKFNRRVQRILESKEYRAIFPDTTIKHGTRPPEYIRTSDEVEIIGREGSLLSVGREGSLTGNRVDCFILDDLYKDALEANSPLVRENCREWYTSVVKTRMHNDSSELLVFTRWHEEDLIGDLQRVEPVVGLRAWEQLDDVPADAWVALNFEAVKQSAATEIDPRQTGEALWPERQSVAILEAKRRLDPVRFEAMYQGHPSSAEGLLYGNRFQSYDTLPEAVHHVGNYTDTADTGDDYLCSLCYVAGADGVIYITDAVYTREAMEVTELAVSEMLRRNETRRADIESNNGGRGFARAVQRLAPETAVHWFHQSGNKEARILSHSATVLHRLRWPADWAQRWPELHTHLVTYRRKFNANRWHDAADVVTGIVERECSGAGKKGGHVRFL